MSDDFLATSQTSGRVSPGGSARGEVETANDVDWFAVELVAGQTYRINLQGASSLRGTLANPNLYGIYDANSELLAGTTNDNGGRGADSRVFFTASETGTHYIAAGASGNWTGTYRVTVKDITHTFTDDFATGIGTTGTVAVDGRARGEIDQKGDRDWFAVELVAGREYLIDLQGSWGWRHGTLNDAYLYGVHDPRGELIAGTTNDDGGAGYDSRLRFTAAEDGTHYVAAGAYGAERGTYRLSVKHVDDHGAGTGTGGRVTVDGSARSGTVDYDGDVDWFKVSLEAGRTYRIDLEGSDTGAGTLGDPYIHGIHDTGGALIADTTDDDGGEDSNSQVTFTATETGTHYVAAGADGNGVGTYRLSVSDITHIVNDDYAAGIETTGTVLAALRGQITGVMNYEGDVDWIRWENPSRSLDYQIDILGHAREQGPRFDPRLLGIYRSNGDRVNDFEDTMDDDSGAGLNSRVTWGTVGDTAYYIAVGGHGRTEGTYTLKISGILPGHDDFDDIYDTDVGEDAQQLLADDLDSQEHTIDYPGDRDRFELDLEQGTTYRIELTGRGGLVPLRDPYIYGIWTGEDISGSPLAGTTNNNGGAGLNSRLNFTAEQDGIHTLVVGGAFTHHEGDYRLWMRVHDLDDLDDVHVLNHTPLGETILGNVLVGNPLLSSAHSSIEVPGDRDAFDVELVAGRTYRIDLRGDDTGDGTLDNPYLYGIFGPYMPRGNARVAGTTDDDDGGIGRNSRLQFTPEASGTYFVSVGARGDETGTYTLTVTDLGAADDFTADKDTTGVVVVGGSARGELEARHDIDWFAVELEADTVYRIDLMGRMTRDGTLRDPLLYGLYDADGDFVSGTRSDDGGVSNNSRTYAVVSEAGTYYVAAGAYGGLQGTYRLAVTDDYGDFGTDADTAGMVEVGGSVNGEIELRGDRDWIAVELDAGKIYTFFLKGKGVGALGTAKIYGIFDPDGNRMPGSARDDLINSGVAPPYSTLRHPGLSPDGQDSLVRILAPETGTYHVDVGAGGGLGAITGPYELSVWEGPDDDYAAGTETTAVVAVGGSAAGRIDYQDDLDWFRVMLEVNKTYRVEFSANPNATDIVYPELFGIYDTDGNLHADPRTLYESGIGSYLPNLTVSESGTYYLVVGGEVVGAEEGQDENIIGAYTVSVEEVM